MKTAYAFVLSLVGLGNGFALPGTAPTTSSSASLPIPTVKACTQLCIKGYHLFQDPTTNKCSCVPGNTEKDKCLLTTTCLAGSSPVWDPTSQKCTCEPDTDDQFLCLATTECIPGYVPVWDASTKTCTCKKHDSSLCPGLFCIATHRPYYDPKIGKCYCQKIPISDSVQAAKRDATEAIPQKPTITIASLALTPKPSHLPCEYLKVYCECGDHVMHWSEEKQQCQCTPCEPVVSLRCEDLKIYCNEGDHLMHWDPIRKQCRCPPPMITDYAPTPLSTM